MTPLAPSIYPCSGAAFCWRVTLTAESLRRRLTRRVPDSNWCTRLCRPLPNHSANSPRDTAEIVTESNRCLAPQGHVSATTLAEQREHAEWVRDYLKIEDMDGISAHSLNGRLLVVLDVADKLLAELEQANAALREHS